MHPAPGVWISRHSCDGCGVERAGGLQEEPPVAGLGAFGRPANSARTASSGAVAGLPLRALFVAVGPFVHDAPYACWVAASLESPAGTDTPFALRRVPCVPFSSAW